MIILLNLQLNHWDVIKEILIHKTLKNITYQPLTLVNTNQAL